MTSYSKAPRGLFVLLRVASVFTCTTISPSPSLRQRLLCYAIRAGRNFIIFLNFSKNQTISSSRLGREMACSRYGVTKTSLGIVIESHLDSSFKLSLFRFHRYSHFTNSMLPHYSGKFSVYPTRNFATLGRL